MSFSEYTNTQHSTRYSAEYFAELTIADADEIIQKNRLPPILPRNSIKKWVFDCAMPTAVSEIIVTAGEAVPCLEDIFPITKVAELVFNEQGGPFASRSAPIILSNIEFKMRLILSIKNHTFNMQAASNLLQRAVTSPLFLPYLVEEFKNNKFTEPLSGFSHYASPASYPRSLAL
ncbi:hypothetical protein DFH09DRAFT_1335321 [Mycena vulgaris]|nr:hypothetical protein DFH09DRAFT_1335321 [Mycena vulgaris]